MADGPLAILGATSKIALDFIETIGDRYELCLYARSPSRTLEALRRRRLGKPRSIHSLARFGDVRYGGIVNFIGIGDPSKTVAMGAGIIEATTEWDGRVLAYLDAQPATPYVFLSSGAVYGEAFVEPVTAHSNAVIPVNRLGPQSWYTLAKLMAETRHRAASGRTIVDLRVFNYISRSLDRADRFLINDMIRAIDASEMFETSAMPIVRDYLHPHDFATLVEGALAAPTGTNVAVDAYTLAPIAKADLLDLVSREFGLKYRVVPHPDVVNATGTKPNYYSLNRAAASLGYRPTRTSAEAIVEELTPVLQRQTRNSATRLRMTA